MHQEEREGDSVRQCEPRGVTPHLLVEPVSSEKKGDRDQISNMVPHAPPPVENRSGSIPGLVRSWGNR